MATVSETKLLTAEEFMAADLGEGKFELVRGEIVEMPPPRPEHGRVCVNACFVLEAYGRQSGLGYALANDSAVVTKRNPDTVRGVDVCFYTHTRWPRAQVGGKLPPVPPDVAVEIVSPDDRITNILKKVSEYLEAGVLLVWVVFPKRHQVVIYRASEDEQITFDTESVIENLPELPGFRCSVSDFFV
jgi:Uma2 family endonuclease